MSYIFGSIQIWGVFHISGIGFAELHFGFSRSDQFLQGILRDVTRRCWGYYDGYATGYYANIKFYWLMKIEM